MMFCRQHIPAMAMAAAIVLPIALIAAADGADRPGAAGVVRIRSSAGVVRVSDYRRPRNGRADPASRTSHRDVYRVVYRAQSPDEVLSNSRGNVRPVSFAEPCVSANSGCVSGGCVAGKCASGDCGCGNCGTSACRCGGSGGCGPGGCGVCGCGCGKVGCGCGAGGSSVCGCGCGKVGCGCGAGGNQHRCRPFAGHGTYDIVYTTNSCYFDRRDGRVYSAQGWGMPMAVPLAPNVEHTYNYGWGMPSSRLTPISRGYGCDRGCFP